MAWGQVRRSAEPYSACATHQAPGPFASLPQPPPNGKRTCARGRATSLHECGPPRSRTKAICRTSRLSR